MATAKPKDRRGPGRPSKKAVAAAQKRFSATGEVNFPKGTSRNYRTAALGELRRSGDITRAARVGARADRLGATAGARGGALRGSGAS